MYVVLEEEPVVALLDDPGADLDGLAKRIEPLPDRVLLYVDDAEETMSEVLSQVRGKIILDESLAGGVLPLLSLDQLEALGTRRDG